jgi:N-glycosylase/DNA lyase
MFQETPANQLPNIITQTLEVIMRDPQVRNIVDARIEEFLQTHQADTLRWFEELVFCILTANSRAVIGLRCVEALKEKQQLLNGSENAVAGTLREAGHSFYKQRAERIVQARQHSQILKSRVLQASDISEAREWLVTTFRGIGWKEGSHFLRNVGFFDVAIIDRHILSFMYQAQLIKQKPRNLTKIQYLQYERILKGVANRFKLSAGILDLYLWYMQTGKVLK